MKIEAFRRIHPIISKPIGMFLRRKGAFLRAARMRPSRGHSLDRDLKILRRLGVNHYRFGIEWGRVEPKPGVFNEAAIRQYVSMARKLKAAGIEPIVTLWHFTFPSWLYDSRKKRALEFSPS